MEAILYFIMYMVGVAVGAYCVIVLYRSLLVQKWKTSSIIIYHLITNIFHVILTDYLYYSIILKYISMTTVYLIVVIVMFEGKPWKKAVAFVENYIIVLLQELIVAQIMFGFIGLNPEDFTGYRLNRTLMHLSCVLINILLVIIFVYVHKQINLALSTTKIKYILICLTSQMVAGILYDIIMISNHLAGTIFFLVYIVVSLVVDIYLLRIVVQMEIKESTEQSIDAIIRQDEIAAEYYSGVADNINNLASLRECYEKELNDIYKISELALDETKGSRRDDNENILLSNIVFNVKKQLDKMGCKYDIDMDIPSNARIEKSDLSSLIINLFDNAMDAINLYMEDDKNNKTPQYHLTARANIEENKLTIRVENVKSKKQKTRCIDDKFITTKENKSTHGYGMQIIERIAKKYGGSMKVEYRNNRFVNQVTMEEI